MLFGLKKIFFYTINNLFIFYLSIKNKLSTKSELSKYGFIKFKSKKSKDLTFYLNKIINDPENVENSPLGYFKIINKNNFGIKDIAVDSSSEFLTKYVFTEEILSHINNFFGRKFYLRNNPIIKFNYDGEKENTQLFHVDGGLRQVTVMINLIDLDAHNTHMDYISGSNNQYFFYNTPNRFNKKLQLKLEQLVLKNKILKTTGPSGTVSIFNAGNGYHRQVGGGKRCILHMNFVDNLLHTDWSKNWKPGSVKFLSEEAANAYYFSWKNESAKNQKQKNHFAEIFSLVNRNKKEFAPLIYKT